MRSLIIFVLYELDDDLLLRLYLQHLEHQAQKLGGLLVTAESAPEVRQHHRLVDERLRRQPEAVFLPVPCFWCTEK